MKHLRDIQKHPRHSLEKVFEEYEELRDAHEQRNRWHAVIEAADVVNAAYSFIWKTYRVPFVVVIAVGVSTAVYKPLVRLWRRTVRRNGGRNA